MPANLTPQYLKAEERYKQAKTPQEKLAALQEMLALLPKHKGTEKIQAQLKKKLSKLKEQARQAKRKKGTGPAHDAIEREGAGQIALVGLPNAGKSTLLNRLTHARAPVAEFPFSTFKPVVGMAPFEDVQLQLVDLPPLCKTYTEGWVYSLIRNADRVCVLLDLAAPDFEDDWLELLALLEAAKLQLVGREPAGPFGPSTGVQKALVLGTKADLVSPETIARFEATFSESFACLALGQDSPLEPLRRRLFELLDVIRVYTKQPGKPPDRSVPFVLPRHSTTVDLARAIHRDLERQMKYARVWGSGQFEGQRIPHDYVLQDGDVVEIHT